MATSTKASLGKSELSVVKELAHILRETDLTEIELERGDLKLKISRKAAKQLIQATSVSPSATPISNPQPVAPETPAPANSVDMSVHPGAVASPMVGTVYLSPEPGKSAFVQVGDEVKEGDTLLLIEAMKTFNPIPAPTSGRVLDIVVDDAAPVEFGETLIVIG